METKLISYITQWNELYSFAKNSKAYFAAWKDILISLFRMYGISVDLDSIPGNRNFVKELHLLPKLDLLMFFSIDIADELIANSEKATLPIMYFHDYLDASNSVVDYTHITIPDPVSNVNPVQIVPFYFFQNRNALVIDGNHRISAAKNSDVPHIEAYVYHYSVARKLIIGEVSKALYSMISEIPHLLMANNNEFLIRYSLSQEY